MLPLLLLTLAADRRPLDYAPAPADNPLKGLVPYAGQGGSKFPHSLEFDYLPVNAVVVGPGKYDWTAVETLLNAVAGRGHQAVVRFYLEYPAKPTAVPAYLLADGLKVHKYQNINTQPLPPAEVTTPDYADPRLRTCLTEFVVALGRRYDGDPRLGFLHAGLLGTWGEWHTYPREELFPKPAVQAELLDAFQTAFHKTPVLLRYPAGPGDAVYADNSRRPFGYHDDSFAWATLPTGRAADDWFYLSLLKKAGPDAEARWKTHPIGGEIRPEAWGQVFDDKPKNKQVQDFVKCVEATHATWLMDSGMFGKTPPAGRRERAEARVRRLGYEFHAPAVMVGPAAGGVLPVRLELENRGVAPFYADWRPEYGFLSGDKVVRTVPGSGRLTGLLPGDRREWADALDVAGLPAGEYRLLVRVPNPVPKGNPVRFANHTQDADRLGWLSLGPVRLP
jgi:hypothetical protein